MDLRDPNGPLDLSQSAILGRDEGLKILNPAPSGFLVVKLEGKKLYLPYYDEPDNKK